MRLWPSAASAFLLTTPSMAHSTQLWAPLLILQMLTSIQVTTIRTASPESRKTGKAQR